MNVNHILKRLLKKEAVDESRLDVERVPFPELRDRIKKITGFMAEAKLDLDKLVPDLEDYGAKSWRRERETIKKYHRMVDGLFLLLDHLENLAKGEKKSDEIEWLYTRIRRILEDEAIEEIQVSKGQLFNGRYYKQADSRHDELPVDAVLEVIRKGYFIEGLSGQEDVILRLAEVIVSSGPSEKKTETNLSEEAKE
jgi:molecular chaperone GrpE (heat shock protein)